MNSEEQRIIELARAMVYANPHAAEVLAEHLGHFAAEELRPRFAQGAGIMISVNPITMRVDLRSSEPGAS